MVWTVFFLDLLEPGNIYFSPFFLGDIISLSIFGQTIIILNSADIALEMLDNKGSLYSDRQTTPMIQLTGWADAPVFLSTGKSHRQHRAYMHKLLGTPIGLSRFHGLIETENHNFLRRVLNSPQDLADHIRLSVYFQYF
jgi:hypothetical protein